MLWEGRERRGVEEGREEREWAEGDGFLRGSEKHVGKLGELLGEYEEEREAERVRMMRRERMAEEVFLPEEDSDSDEDIKMDEDGGEDEVKEQDAKELFERVVREWFIYGLLDVSPSITLILALISCSRSIMIPWIGMTSSTPKTIEKLKRNGSKTTRTESRQI
jgi:hypothetical protein